MQRISAGMDFAEMQPEQINLMVEVCQEYLYALFSCSTSKSSFSITCFSNLVEASGSGMVNDFKTKIEWMLLKVLFGKGNEEANAQWAIVQTSMPPFFCSITYSPRNSKCFQPPRNPIPLRSVKLGDGKRDALP